MSTFSNNTTLKVNAAVSANRTTNGNFYTAPANGYAILNISAVRNGGGDITVGGRTVFQMTQFSGQSEYISPGDYYSSGINNAGATSSKSGVYVGPGQIVALSGVAGSPSFDISGVEFVNTP